MEQYAYIFKYPVFFIYIKYKYHYKYWNMKADYSFYEWC